MSAGSEHNTKHMYSHDEQITVIFRFRLMSVRNACKEVKASSVVFELGALVPKNASSYQSLSSKSELCDSRSEVILTCT